MLIWRMKFDRGKAAATPLAQILDITLPYFSEEVIIVPIPTATSRVRQRGYDQSKLIASELARARKRLYSPLLHRMGQEKQVGKPRPERLKSLHTAYRVSRSRLVRGAHIVLVDDVTTTGATIEAAALAMKRAGAKTVDAAIVAKNKL